MRLAVALVILLSACGAKPTSGPEWPKTAAKDTDGGESIAPRAKAASVAAAADDDDDEIVVKPTVEKPAEKTDAKPEAAKPATPGAPQAPEEIVITTEEIVIEIDE